MRRSIRWVARLYPRPWRERYGAEFDALLADTRAGWRELFNVLGGAIQMQFWQSRSIWPVVLACAAIGIVVAGALSFAHRQYVSTASLRIVAPPGSNIPAPVEIDRLQRMILSDSNLIGLMTDPRFDLYRDERRHGMALLDVAGRMRQDIQIRQTPASMAISFAYPDKVKAQMVVRKLSEVFEERSANDDRLRATIWERGLPGSQPIPLARLESVHAADLPGQPNWLKILPYLTVGLGGGVLLGLIAVYVGRRPRRALAVAALGICGAVVSIAISFLVPDKFTSTATILVTPSLLHPFDREAVARDFHETEARVFADENLKALAHNAVRWWKSAMPEEQMAAALKSGAVRIQLFEPPTAFTIQYSSHDRRFAKVVVDTVLASFEEVHARRSREAERSGSAIPTVVYGVRTGSIAVYRLASLQAGSNYEALDLSNVPTVPSSPPRLYVLIAGLVLGCLAGALIVERRRSLPVNRGQHSLGTV